MKHEQVDQEVAEALECLRQVPPPDEERQQVRRVAFMGQAGRYRQRFSPRDHAGRARTRRLLPLISLGSRRMAIAGLLVALVLALIAGTGGVIYAAESSVPGDPLYGIDRTVESVRLGLTTRPEATTRLLISLAEERLQEAQQLSARGDTQNLDVAINDLGAVVSSLAQAVGASKAADQAAVADLLDDSFPAPNAQPADVSQDVDTTASGDDGQSEPKQDEADRCAQADSYPVAEKLAESFDVPVEDILSWFCEGNYGFGEIMLALKTGQETGMPAQDLLASKTELGGWGKVWQEMGLIGRPAKVAVGRPDRSSTSDSVPSGSPEDAVPAANVAGSAPAEAAAEPAQSEDEQDSCVGANPHPVAEKLAESYDVPIEDIMSWFCEGNYGFGEIKLALETSLETGKTPEELLAMKTELGGWGEVWQELGLIGKPAKDGTDETSADAPAEPGQSEDEQESCVGVDPHPVAEKLAESYDVPIEDIMSWFCEGRYGFGEIKLALQTSLETDKTPEELLAMKTELGGWGEVWQELGLIGKSAKDKPAKDKSVAPSVDKPQGTSKDKSGGPPESKPTKEPKDNPGKSKGKGNGHQ